ncbi:uncharacterized protein RAG0_07920 [Rhynchosporium agropyri]|uniref:Transcription factor RfeG n=1 Tax=Rhynchosporium agropyri TaxID=914238 RepID=A0A1E1KNI4_9HELO|nr:uncharacterized protein RAG0_07920 [Rhynchosporium agropyri]
MSSRDIRERERRAVAAAPSNSVRTNEYFVPKDGIDREVITADICRYLGNDALVRPGNYEDPATRQVRAGYFITAYRNLTTAMIADLKADSDRWDAERRATASRGQPVNVGYRDSTTHQSRQYYGPTEQVPGGASSYVSPPTSAPQGVYDSGSQSQYQQAQQPYANQPVNTGYTQPGYPIQDNNYYTAGADLVADPRSRAPAQPGVGVPRSQQYASSQSAYQQPDPRYYGQAGPPGGQVQQHQQPVYPTQPNDPYYGRGQVLPVSGPSYDTQDAYDNSRQYQDTYSSQPPLASSSSTPATSNTSSRRERERDPEPRDRHHRRR